MSLSKMIAHIMCSMSHYM